MIKYRKLFTKILIKYTLTHTDVEKTEVDNWNVQYKLLAMSLVDAMLLAGSRHAGTNLDT